MEDQLPCKFHAQLLPHQRIMPYLCVGYALKNTIVRTSEVRHKSGACILASIDVYVSKKINASNLVMMCFYLVPVDTYS